MKLSYQKTTLANGLRVVTCAMPHAYSVGVGFNLSIGSRYEDEEIAGAAHFVEHMIFKGTGRRPSPQAIAAAIEGHGGLFNASTSRETSVLWAKMQQEHLSLALDVLTDMLRNSQLLPEEIAKEQRVILEEISSSRDIPEELVALLAHQITWPDHPLGRDIAGTPESVVNLKREVLQTFMATHYGPQNLVLSIAGDVLHEHVVELAAAFLEDWQPADSAAFLPAPPARTTPHVALIQHPSEQTHLTLHLPGFSRRDDDRYVLGLLNVVLGEGMSSRLFLEIRERLGLAYAVDSYVSYLSDTGILGVYAAVAPHQASTALRAILDQLRRLRDEPVDNQTLRAAKEFAKGRLVMGMEDTLAVASWFGRQEVQNDPVLTVEEVITRLNAVTADDIQRVAARLLRQNGACLAIVGPHEEAEVGSFEHVLATG